VLALIEFWEEVFELLLPLVIKPLAIKASQEYVHVHGRDIKADQMIKDHVIIKALAVPGRYGAGLWVQFEVLHVHSEFRPGDTVVNEGLSNKELHSCV
jgi:hypothetical protein